MSSKIIPPCQAACPIHTDVRGYISAIEKGDIEAAIKINRKVNPLPAVCGRICTRPCESVCRRGQVDEPVAIAWLKRFAADYTKGIKIPQVRENNYDEKVAVIGGGPAGLSSAYKLALYGYRVTIFEAMSRLGGMLREGIPEFRLPKDVVEDEIYYIMSLGIESKTGVSVGRDFTIEGLLRDFQAVILALGSQKSLVPKCKGSETSKVITAVEFLKQVCRGERPILGKHVVIIGGGHTAIDTSRTCIRLGARDVTIVYRRTINEMPICRVELEEAEEEGVKVRFLSSPVSFFCDEKGNIDKVCCIEMRLGEPDETGRCRPIPVENSEFEIRADTIISAIGYMPEEEILNKNKILVNEKGRVKVDEKGATNVKGVFACGDVVTGPSNLINAIASGKKVAKTVHSYLRNQPLESDEEFSPMGRLNERIVNLIPRANRVKMTFLPIEERKNCFAEVELGYSYEQAIYEAGRCLKCGTSELSKKLRGL
ncbi:MAG: FAD-dependent oxidoreductase [Nitrospirae bacterium]|nr:FAD-dependent oxidoreductase [Nitrospirota bacterium]